MGYGLMGWNENRRPSAKAIAEENRAMQRRQEHFRIAAEYVAAPLFEDVSQVQEVPQARRGNPARVQGCRSGGLGERHEVPEGPPEGERTGAGLPVCGAADRRGPPSGGRIHHQPRHRPPHRQPLLIWHLPEGKG